MCSNGPKEKRNLPRRRTNLRERERVLRNVCENVFTKTRHRKTSPNLRDTLARPSDLLHDFFIIEQQTTTAEEHKQTAGGHPHLGSFVPEPRLWRRRWLELRSAAWTAPFLPRSGRRPSERALARKFASRFRRQPAPSAQTRQTVRPMKPQQSCWHACKRSKCWRGPLFAFGGEPILTKLISLLFLLLVQFGSGTRPA